MTLPRAVPLLVLLVGTTITAANAQASTPPIESAVKPGCFATGLRVGGGNPDAPAIEPTSFLRIVTPDRSFGELLGLPIADHAFISTDGLIPAPSGADDRGLSCSIVRYGYSGSSPSIFGDACPPFTPVVVDNGPVVSLSAVARRGLDAVLRVRIDYNKMFQYGTYDIDEKISFAADGVQSLTLSVRGVEPVYVTARFPHLSKDAHQLTYWVADMRAVEQGIVCI